MSYEEAFKNRKDLEKYNNNSLLLFALEMRFEIEDIHTVASDSLTDGRDDKKCDLIYINHDEGSAVIAQGYICSDISKKEAPANKASDLNTASGWLLGRDLTDLPDRIKPAATQLHNALKDGLIKTVELWYVHNLPGSTNVENELKTVQANASTSLRRFLDNLDTKASTLDTPNVVALEVSKNKLDEWYQALTMPILVCDSFELEVIGGYSMDSGDWSAFVTAVPARWLYEQFSKYKERLFSANIRGYLGSRKTDLNINNGIKDTALSDAGNFWVFNNGLTILTEEFSYKEEPTKKLSMKGMSIVNGAQTTGAVGSLKEPPSSTVMISARFVQCKNRDVITKIIQYNNSQNKVEASDFRSNDDIQKRLREEFEKIPSVKYLGGRRGGHEDRMKRPANLLPSDTAGQALAALHGDVLIAYNQKSQIWISDSLYSRFFSSRTTANHIIFAYSLLRAVEEKKRQLTNTDKVNLTEQEKHVLSFFRNRGATFLLVSAIASSLEAILGKAVDDKFSLIFKGNKSPQDCIKIWEPIVKISSAFSVYLIEGLEGGLNNADRVKKSISIFASLMKATQEANKDIYSEFSKNIEIHKSL